MAKKGIDPRAKGKAAERDICDRLNHVLCRDKKIFRRTFHAVDDRMFDIDNPFGLAIEVKCQKNSSIPSWWRQACSQVTDEHPIPILFYKLPRRDWCVLVGNPRHSGRMIPKAKTMRDFYEWALIYLTERNESANV